MADHEDAGAELGRLHQRSPGAVDQVLRRLAAGAGRPQGAIPSRERGGPRHQVPLDLGALPGEALVVAEVVLHQARLLDDRGDPGLVVAPYRGRRAEGAAQGRRHDGVEVHVAQRPRDLLRLALARLVERDVDLPLHQSLFVPRRLAVANQVEADGLAGGLVLVTAAVQRGALCRGQRASRHVPGRGQGEAKTGGCLPRTCAASAETS
mmetsp:Transcript_20173/g.56697  ORF Transcript_20173/g.56697 Transcript_20173/m.56697 type:complete len:208 (+) Transcript_20173:240-863(+)